MYWVLRSRLRLPEVIEFVSQRGALKKQLSTSQFSLRWYKEKSEIHKIKNRQFFSF
jgi:hypothetical protein